MAALCDLEGSADRRRRSAEPARHAEEDDKQHATRKAGVPLATHLGTETRWLSAHRLAERPLEGRAQGGVDIGHRRGDAERGERGHAVAGNLGGDAARDDAAVMVEIGVDVDRDAVIGHPAPHPHPDCSDLGLARRQSPRPRSRRGLRAVRPRPRTPPRCGCPTLLAGGRSSARRRPAGSGRALRKRPAGPVRDRCSGRRGRRGRPETAPAAAAPRQQRWCRRCRAAGAPTARRARARRRRGSPRPGAPSRRRRPGRAPRLGLTRHSIPSGPASVSKAMPLDMVARIC